MADYRIYPDWKDVLVYDEGDGRTLRLDCDGVREPYTVSVPSADHWTQKMPGWTFERRSLILDRLRSAGCIISEEHDWTRSVFSPDGSCRVELYWEPDDRGAPASHAIRVVAHTDAGDAEILNLADANQAGVIAFPEPGVVVLPFEVYRVRRQVRINVVDRTYQDHPNEPARPLAELASAVAAITPPPPARPIVAPSTKSRLAAVGNLLACALFVAAGVWQAVDGKRTRDHVLGALCALFFFACAFAPLSDLGMFPTKKAREREDRE